MKPSQLAKQLGASSMGAIASSYGIHPVRLNQIFDRDPKRFEHMVKVHVLSNELSVSCQHLDFLIANITNDIKGRESESYFLEVPEAKSELTRFHVIDFKMRMRDMCEKLTNNETLQALITERLEVKK